MPNIPSMKNRIFLLFGLLWSFQTLQAQVDQAIKYAGAISLSDLKRHMYVLASDSLEGRETGKPGLDKAARYIANEFKKYGIPALNGSYFQNYVLDERKPNGVSISTKKSTFGFLTDFYFFPGFGDQEIEASDMLFLGYGIEDSAYNDYAGMDVKDKVIVILNGEPYGSDGNSLLSKKRKPSLWTTWKRKKAETAREKGVKAVLIIDDSFEKNVLEQTHGILTPTLKLENEPDESRTPIFFISPSMADRVLKKTGLYNQLKSQIDESGKPVRKKIKNKIKFSIKRQVNKLNACNVVGFIEGKSKKEEVVVLTAHFDHLGKHDGKIFYGADDDASGTTALIAIAKAFAEAKNNGNGPERSILIMPVSGEEKGLLGSSYYVEHPLFPLANTVADLNIDMIGRIDTLHKDGNYIYLIGSDKLSSDLHRVSEETNRQCCQLDLDYRYDSPKDPNRFYYRSDHYNFAKNRIPVIFYFNGVHADYHQATDTKEKIDFNKMEKITNLVFFTAWELANRPDRIKLDK